MTRDGVLSPELARLRAIQRAVQRLATSPEPPEGGVAALARDGMQEEDARALSAFSRERTGVYGGLVGRTVLGAVQNQLPATARHLSESARVALVQRFLEEAPPRSPYLRDVPFEFAMWMEGQWGALGVPAHLPDLARFELLAFAAGSAESGPRPAEPAPLAADRPVWLDGTVHLARLDHAVHLLLAGEDTPPLPEQRPVALLVHRDADNEVRWLELDPTSMEALRLLVHGTPFGEAIRETARALGRPLDASLIETVSATLADLATRGALLGASPPERAPPDSSPYRAWLTGPR